MGSAEPLNIRLKLMSDSNVILAKCEGFETEIFMPTILNGRISLINLVPQRRCDCISTTHIVAKQKSNFCRRRELNASETITNWRLSTASTNSSPNEPQPCTLRPMANSTPAQSKTTSLTLLTPEQVRCAPQPLGQSMQLPMLNLQRTACRLNFQAMENEEYALIPSDNCVENFTSDNNEASQLSLPANESEECLVLLYDEDEQNLTSNLPSPNATLNTLITDSPCTPQWRKVITPIRTYARRQLTPCNYSPQQKQLPATYLRNPTQSLKGEGIITVQKRRTKLDIDKKLAISPHSFKLQLQTSTELPNIKLEYESLKSELRKKPAFDLLTTSMVTSGCMSKRLKQQFRSCCINKGSSTYPKYKRLCQPADETIPNFRNKCLEWYIE